MNGRVRPARGLSTLALLVVLLQVAGGLPRADAAGRPNVLLLLIDDLGARDLGIDGSTFHDTPRLDALARASARFTQAYSSHPVCSPTRAALMTGKVPQRLGVTDWIAPGTGVALPASEVTLGEAFQSAGYQTAYLGKWHLGETDADQPQRHGFEWTRGVNRAGQPATYVAPFRRSVETPSVWDVPDFESCAPGAYLTDVLTDAAIQFLEQRDTRRPFLMCIGHYAVHTPIESPAALTQKYEERRRERFGDSATPVIHPVPGVTTRARQDDPKYAAMLENLDMNVGRLLDALDRLGLGRDTLVVFTSDNGGLSTLAGQQPGPTCDLPYRTGKGWTYEGGIRVPLWIRRTGHIEPRVLDVPVTSVDLYPTLLSLCGLPARPEQHVDGVSLASELKGVAEPRLRTRSLGWFYPHGHGSGHVPSAALRRGPWKWVQFLREDRAELYDVASDPGETRNRAADEPELARELAAELERWIGSTRGTRESQSR